MNIFVIICCNAENDEILFVDVSYTTKEEAIEYCCSLNDTVVNAGIYYDYREIVLFSEIKG